MTMESTDSDYVQPSSEDETDESGDESIDADDKEIAKAADLATIYYGTVLGAQSLLDSINKVRNIAWLPCRIPSPFFHCLSAE